MKEVKVAVVQTAPIFLDKEATIDLACKKVAEAADNGAELIVFPEAWISGYPYWGEGWESKLEDFSQVRVQFYDNSIIIPSQDTDRLCAAARDANAHVVIGCNEMDARPGVHTIYNTLLFIERSGKILGRHRKVMPTFVERAFWGNGDGSTLVSYETDIGRIGGLICGEHMMTLVRARMILQGEDFHIGVFPGAFALHTGPKLEEADLEGDSFWGHTLTKAHALESGSFVLSSCGYITENDLPEDFPMLETINVDYAHGGSSILSPLGVPLVPPTSGDTIIYASCQADMIKVWNAVIDTVGHYARPDILSLDYHADPYQQIVEIYESSKRNDIDRIAEKNEVSVEDVDRKIEEIVKYSTSVPRKS
jgi:predicted amidohydrolase